jgi:hypothetical protein
MKHIPDAELALYSGNDLENAAHLSECAECRSKLEKLRAAGEWLKRTATEPSEEQLDALRSSVLHVVKRRRKIVWWPAAATAASIAVVMATRGFKHSVKESVPGPVAVVAQTPIQSFVPIGLGPLPRKPRRRAKARPAPMTLLAQHGGDPVIRLRTSDPNIVVLWVMNTTPKEGSQNE